LDFIFLDFIFLIFYKKFWILKIFSEKKFKIFFRIAPPPLFYWTKVSPSKLGDGAGLLKKKEK